MSSTYSFHEQAAALFEQLGDHRKMVLSTSADGRVTSRMMSILILSRAFYFQTDQSMRKFRQTFGSSGFFDTVPAGVFPLLQPVFRSCE